jgi:YidC/Oxa1 family membrane protein insertase
MDKRTMLAIVLSMLVLFIYQTFFVKPPPKKPAAPQQKEAVTPAPAAPSAPAAPGESAVAPATAPAANTAAAPRASAREKDISVETGLYSAVFTTRGGALKSFQLKDYRTELPEERRYSLDGLLGMLGFKKKADQPARPVELVHVQEGMSRPLAVTFPESTVDVPAEGIYEADAGSIDIVKSPDRRRLTFSQTYPSRIRVEKTYTFQPDKFAFDLEIRVYNLSAAPIHQKAQLGWHQFVDPKAETDSYTHEGPVIYVTKKIEREDVKKIDKVKLFGPDVSWGGFETKYFIASMIPQNPSLTSLVVSKDGRNLVSTSLSGPKNLIPAGQAGMFSYSLFLGPKDYSLLKAQGIGLENAIDFGDWLKWLAMPMLISLKYMNEFVKNFGIAIIILTILIKILFWPLGNKSYESMKAMQKLQPKMQELRDKFKDDKQKLSQETMALYRAHKVNPMGGCLPMLIQIPVFFGLYKALLYAIELRHAPFFWWIQDLSAKDPYYITPIIMGATMFIQQKMTPTAGDPMQQKIMLFLPIIFTFLFLNFPSGLVIYWLFNNILSIGQQYYVNKKHS